MSIEMLDVWVNDKKVGRLFYEDHEYSFQYQNIGLLDPQRDLVSLTMPVRIKQYDTQVLMPPFQIALPEGALLENLRVRFGKVMNISNDFVLLKLVGNHTIGRVRFTDENRTLETGSQFDYSLSDLLTYPETETLFRELIDQLAPRSGVSGVQPKVLWNEYDKKMALLTGHYILKSAGREYPGLAVNEYFCLKAAQACGLATPRFHLADSGEMLVVERFDIDKDSHQLAFEEVCALLHLPNYGKYTGSYEDIADIIQKVPCEPLAGAMRDFFKSVILSMMIKNGDAHLKNFGILYDDTTRKWFAPIYDLVTTIVYIRKDVPALTIAGKKQWPDLEALKRFGLHACGLRRKAVKQCIDEVKAGVQKIIPQLKQFGAKYKVYRELCERMASVMTDD